MKKSALICGGILLAIQAAKAADLPVAPPQPVERVAVAPDTWDWSGFYVGVDGGYGWGHDPSSMPVNLDQTLNGIDSKGYLVGGHAGYNWQRGIWVGGLELDMSFTDIKGTSSASETIAGSTSSTSLSEKFDYLGSGRARVGIVPWHNLLLYGTGGLAWTRLTSDFTSRSVMPGFSINNTSSTPTSAFGWVGGGGVEVSLGSFGIPNLLIRGEYLHYDFGDGGSSSSTFGGTTTTSTSGRVTVDVVRGGLSLKL